MVQKHNESLTTDISKTKWKSYHRWSNPEISRLQMSHRLQFQIGHKHLEMKQKSKCSSLVAQLLSVAGDHGSHPGGGEKNFIFRFWVVISWLLLTLKFIHDYAKWSIHELIHHVWLSIRLNNLIAGHKN